MLAPSEIAGVVEEVTRGNREAFGRIVRAYSLPLRSYLAAHVHNLDDVDDLAQAVLLAAYRTLHSFRPDENFGAWLRGIARNKVYDHLRLTARRDRALSAFREEVARTVEADLDRAATSVGSDAIEALLRCVAQLPDKLRRVVRAGLDGERPAALAKALATTVGAVYNLHYRANQLLWRCLQKELADGPGPA
jgi:RNA polymerase sigma-70 factor (ECF subfamily)